MGGGGVGGGGVGVGGSYFFLSLYSRCFLVSRYTLDAAHPMLRATLWQTRNYSKIYAYKNARKFPETVRSTERKKGHRSNSIQFCTIHFAWIYVSL